MFQIIKNSWRFVLDLLFPILCANCGKENTYLCDACLEQLTFNFSARQICPGCGRHSPFGQTHAECRPHTSLDGLIFACEYQEPAIKKLISWLKYQNIKDASLPCAQLLVNPTTHLILQLINQYPLNKIIISPIPLHPKRLKWRGYNQSYLIGARLSNILRLPYQTNLLSKIKHTKAQAKLNRNNRVINAANSFKILAPVSQNTTYILVDDVATTRATLNAAARQLKTASAIKVWAVTVAFES